MRNDVMLVTGGAGFIGSAVIRRLIRENEASVVNVDVLTYAANLGNLAAVERDPRYRFERRTIAWYLANEGWWKPLRAAATRRLGLVG